VGAKDWNVLATLVGWSGSRRTAPPVADVFGLHAELLARPNAPLRPGLDLDAPGGPTFHVIDPYGNVLRFAQASTTAT